MLILLGKENLILGFFLTNYFLRKIIMAGGLQKKPGKPLGGKSKKKSFKKGY